MSESESPQPSRLHRLLEELGIVHPSFERWDADPLVVIDRYDEVLFNRPGSVIYHPKDERTFEGGAGEVRDAQNDAVLLTFTLRELDRYDSFRGFTFSYRGEPFIEHPRNVTLKGTDDEGVAIRILINQHAASFSAQKVGYRLVNTERTDPDEGDDGE